MSIEKILIANGYTKQVIKGTYHLILSESMKEVTKHFIYNINHLSNWEERFNSRKNALNKVEIIDKGITVFTKDFINFEIIGNKVFTYIQ